MKTSSPMPPFASPGNNPTTRQWWSLFAVVFIIVAVYWQSTGHGFVNFDDQYYLFENNRVKAGLSTANIAWAFATLTLSNWHPVTWLSYMLDVQLFGVNPSAHHCVNICLHVVNSVLLFWLLWRTTGKWNLSLCVAALFGLHPLHVESVAWVSERKDLLSTLFMFIAMLLYSGYARTPRLRTYLLALLAFAVGLMAKPMIMTLPFVLLLWDYWPLYRLSPEKFRGDVEGHNASRSFIYLMCEKIPFFVLSLLSLVITFYAQQQGGAVSSIKSVPMSFRIVNALLSYVRYLINTIWPHNLAVIYPLPENAPLIAGLAAGGMLLGITCATLMAARRAPYLVTGWFWYLGTLVPVIGLVQVGSQAMADRYTYIPLIGFFMMATWGCSSLTTRFRLPSTVVRGTVVVVLAILSVCTWRQISYWQNGITLFQHAAEAVPGNFAAYRLLGNALAYKESMASAAACYKEALRIRPDDEETYMDWGLNLARLQRYDEAVERMAVAIRLKPDSAAYRHDFGLVLAEMGRLDDAISQYQEAVRFSPDAVEMQYDLALALGMKGDLNGAVTWLGKVLAARPNDAEAHYNMGIALIKLGKKEDGVYHLSAALQIMPEMTEAKRALEAARYQVSPPRFPKQ